jgi:hypothetical protein
MLKSSAEFCLLTSAFCIQKNFSNHSAFWLTLLKFP